VVAAAIGLSAATGLAERGVALVSSISGGLPLPALPAVGTRDVLALLPAAVAIALVVFSESVLAVRERLLEHAEHTNADRELAALGAAGLPPGCWVGSIRWPATRAVPPHARPVSLARSSSCCARC